MNGKLIDACLLVSWLGAFLIVADLHPSVANLLIALLGAAALGWYNNVIRHDPKTDALRVPWQWRQSPVIALAAHAAKATVADTG